MFCLMGEQRLNGGIKMERWRGLPGLRPGAIFLVALSLSIGWGIRGNFGHESGAMIAGVLASIAACLMSGRSDWRRRVAFFALCGGLGFGFGGSIFCLYHFLGRPAVGGYWRHGCGSGSSNGPQKIK